MDPRSRLIAPCWREGNEPSPTSVGELDMSAFLHRLLLFDEYILESHLLQEFQHVVRAFGARDVEDALDRGALRIRSQALTVAQTAQSDLAGNRPQGILSYSFARLNDADFDEAFHRNLTAIDAIPGLLFKDAKSLRRSIADRWVRPVVATVDDAIVCLCHDMDSNAPRFVAAIRLALQQLYGRTWSDNLSLEVEFTRDGLHRVCRSNLPQLFNLNPIEHHRVVERALLTCAGLEQRLQDLRHHDAVFGMRSDEVELFDSRIRALWLMASPGEPERQMNRVLQLKGLPDIDAAVRSGAISLKAVLEIRETEECRLFRQWLRDTSHLSDDDVIRVLDSLGGRLSQLAHGNVGKTIRLAASTLVGVIPVVGPLLGAAVSAVDTFLLEKIFPRNGVLHFVGVQYPSLFSKSAKELATGAVAPSALPEGSAQDA